MFHFAPALPVTPRRRRGPIVGLLTLVARIVVLLATAAAWLTWQALRTTGRATALAVEGSRWSLTAEHRAACAPAWLLTAAAASWLWLPAAEWWWTGAALLVDVPPAAVWARLPRRVLSERERSIVARTLAGVALVLTLPGLPGAWPLVLLAVAVAAGAVPWWAGRRVRPTVEPEDVVRWRDEVVPRVPKLDGEWVEFDEARRTGVLELTAAKASEVAKLDEDAEWALNQQPGTVTIAADPRLTVRRVRVAFTDPEDGGRLRSWEGPTLRPDGRFVVSYGKGAVPLYGRLYSDVGGTFISIVAPPGSGKGSILRLVAVEASLAPDIEWLGVDGKRGAGIGYLAPGAHTIATSPSEWMDLIHGYWQLVNHRAALAGRRREDSFVVRPGEPRWMLVIDELPKVLKHGGTRLVGWLEDITATSRSLGMGLCTAVQKGDAGSYGSTLIRSNMLDNGWLWMGPATDNQARAAGLQGHDFDPSTLPAEPGWCAVLGAVLGGQPVIPGRTLWVPNRQDVRKELTKRPDADEADVCPFGPVEAWLERDTVHPDLDPEQLTVLRLPDPAEARRRRAEAAAATGHDADTTADRPALAVVDDDPPPADGWSRIATVLATKVPADRDGLLRGEIATETGLSARQVSKLLSRHQETGAVTKNDRSEWSLAS